MGSILTLAVGLMVQSDAIPRMPADIILTVTSAVVGVWFAYVLGPRRLVLMAHEYLRKQLLKMRVTRWSVEVIQRQSPSTVRGLTQEIVELLTAQQQRAYLEHHRAILVGGGGDAKPMNLCAIEFPLAILKEAGMTIQEAVLTGASIPDLV